MRQTKRQLEARIEELNRLQESALNTSQELGLRQAVEYLTGERLAAIEGEGLWQRLGVFKKTQAHRQRLPELRQGVTRKLKIPRPEKSSRADERATIARWLRTQGAAGAALAEKIEQRAHGGSFQGEPLKMWVTINTYPDGRPGEIFIKADKTGSLASGALDAVAIALSMAWQHGVPFEATMEKFIGFRFEPNGPTGDLEYPIVASALDYVARWALARFGKEEA